MDQEGVDAGSSRRPKRFPQQPMCLFEINIAHHAEVAVQITVADGRDDNISDLATIDAGDLLCGLWSHVKDLGVVEDMVRFDQAPTVLRNSSIQSEIKSGVCTAI
jgi:hypothetical protein